MVNLMRKILKKSLILTVILMLIITPVSAKDRIKILADMDTGFSLQNKELPEEISFVATQAETVDTITIPQDSRITAKVLCAEQERRWHKSGIIICKVKNYCPEGVETPIDVSERDIYLIVRKFEPINKKEAWILGTEIFLLSGASFFAPGVDVGYFFLKGAVIGDKHPNRFIAGVHNAYDNSICWFWLKGKPIELNPDDLAKAKNITPKKAQKLIAGAQRRNLKREIRYEKRIKKLDKKFAKREYKYDKKMVKCSVVEQAIEAELADTL